MVKGLILVCGGVIIVTVFILDFTASGTLYCGSSNAKIY